MTSGTVAIPRGARRDRLSQGSMSVSQRMQAQRFSAFKDALRERALKSTSQRDDIARVFFANNRHISVE